jgi:recombination protein RecA
MKALAFHASVRLRLKNMGTIKAKVKGQEQVVGIKVRAQVIKNRMGPPLRSADFDIFFDRGIDNYGAWISAMKDYGIIKQGGAWYTYVNETTGEEIKFQSKDFEDILTSHPDMRDDVYSKICDATISQYKSNQIAEDELSVGTLLDE